MKLPSEMDCVTDSFQSLVMHRGETAIGKAASSGRIENLTNDDWAMIAYPCRYITLVTSFHDWPDQIFEAPNKKFFTVKDLQEKLLQFESCGARKVYVERLHFAGLRRCGPNMYEPLWQTWEASRKARHLHV